jgi:hypothetical protein
MNIFAYGELSDFVILQFWERGRDRKKWRFSELIQWWFSAWSNSPRFKSVN